MVRYIIKLIKVMHSDTDNLENSVMESITDRPNIAGSIPEKGPGGHAV